MARKSEPAVPQVLPPATEEQVVEYVRAHPDFLARHPDLVTKLSLPSRFAGGTVVDMQEYVISRLNDELDQMRGCAEHLITTSRSNMSTQSRTHEAALAVLGAGSMDALLRVIGEDFPALLDVDVATIGFEPHNGAAILLPGYQALPTGMLNDSMGQGDVVLRGATAGEPIIFGDAASLISSFALVRLDPPAYPPGMLALGSRNERTFHSSQGTELLAFLGHIIEDCVSRWWPEA